MLLRTLPLLLALGASLAACGDANGPGEGNRLNLGAGDAGAVVAGDGGALSTEQSALLRALREEESLARDTYTALQGNGMIFSNIAASEQTHTDAVRALLVRYGVPDPGAGRAAGTFESAAFQALYADLVAQGRASTVSALQVGAEIEEMDIADLRTTRARFTQADALATLDLLEQGSRNHLRAFWRQLQSAGASYAPQHLDAASFASIINSATESGGMGR